MIVAPSCSIGLASFRTTVVTVQPGLGIGLLPTTPSGIWTRRAMVAAPAQPCGTTSTA